MADFELSGLLELDATDYVGGAEEAGAASEEMADSADETSESLLDFDAAGAAAGAALTAVGTAAQEALDRTQQLRAELNQTAVTTGSTNAEMRQLAREVSDAATPLKETTGMLSILAERGVTSQEEMRSLSDEFADLALATGTQAPRATQTAIQSMRAFGDEAEDIEEHADTLTMVARQTSLDFNEFGEVVGDIQPVIDELGLSLDDVAARMIALEEAGVNSQRAQELFAQAAEDADGDVQKLNEELDLSQEAIETQKEALQDAEGATEDYAEATEQSLSTTDRLRQTFDEVALSVGGVLEPVSAIAPVLQGLGIAAIGLSTVNLTSLAPSFAAVSAAAGPVAAVILGIGAAATAAAVIWKRDIGGIQDKTEAMVETIGSGVDAVVGAVAAAFDTISYILFEWNPAETLGDVKDAMLGALPTAQDFLAKGEALIDALIQGVRNKIDGVGDAVGDVADKASEFLPGSDAERGALSTLTDQAAAFPETFEQETRAGADDVGDAAGEMAASASDGARSAGDDSGGSGGSEEIVFSFESDSPLEQMLWDALEPQRKREARRAINRGVRQ